MIHHNNNLDTSPRHTVLKMSGGAFVFTKDTIIMRLIITQSYIKLLFALYNKSKGRKRPHNRSGSINHKVIRIG